MMAPRKIILPRRGYVKIHDKRLSALHIPRDAGFFKKFLDHFPLFPHPAHNLLLKRREGTLARGRGDALVNNIFNVEVERLFAIERLLPHKYVSDAHIAMEVAGIKN
jgi:hypothetical protein